MGSMKIAKKIMAILLAFSLLSSIGAEAWAATLTLPEAVKTIEEEAFAGDSSLDEVVLPDGVESIGSRAFANSSMKSINLPSSLTSIAEDAFENVKPRITAERGTYSWDWAHRHGLVSAISFDDPNAYEYETDRAVFSDNEQIGLHHESWIRNYLIDDYDELAKSKQGEPEWSVALLDDDTHGAQLRYEIGEWAGDGKRAIDLIIENEPKQLWDANEPCTLQYRVTCTWGEETVTGTGTLNYVVPDSLPTGLDAADRYDLQIEETSAFRPTVTPENYSFGDFEYCDLWTEMDCDNWDEWEDGECVRYIKPHEAGIFPATLSRRFNNISIQKNVLLYVADKNGVVPMPTLSLDAEYETDRAVFSDNEQTGLYHESWIRNYVIDNYDVLAASKQGEPEWSVELLDNDTHGARLRYEIGEWAGDGNRAIDLLIENEPKQLWDANEPCTLQYRVTCTWDGDSVSTTGTLRYVETALPTGLAAEDTYDLQIGETYAFRPAVIPENYSFGDFEYCDLWTKMNCDNWEKRVDGESVRYIKPHEAGPFVACLVRRFNNIQLRKNILLRVADENGVVPDAVPELEEKYDFGMAVSLDNVNGREIEIHDSTRGINVKNIKQLQSLFEDDYEWTFTQIDGPELALSSRLDNDSFSFIVENLKNIEAPAESSVKATLRWGSGTAETTLKFSFGVPSLPNEITFDRNFTLTVGQVYEATMTLNPEPGYRMGFLGYDTEDNGTIESRLDKNYPYSCFIKANQTGYFRATPCFHIWENASVYGESFILAVREENGALPQNVSFPEEITVPLGLKVPTSGHCYIEGENGVEDLFMSLDVDEADGAYAEIGQYSYQPGILTVTGLQAGTITARAWAGEPDHPIAQQNVTITVVGKEPVPGELSETAAQTFASDPSFAGLTKQRLTVHGMPLYEVYRNDGQKKPVVILSHGGAGNKEDNFRKACGLARDGFYAVTIDIAGCGDSQLGPIDAVKAWEVTVGQVDSLLDYYKASVPQADTERLCLMGTSMGGNFSFVYAAHGKYQPTFIASDMGSPDLTDLGDRPLFDNFDHGEHGVNVLSHDEIRRFAAEYSPINWREKFVDIYVYAGNGEQDVVTTSHGCHALKDYLDSKGGDKHEFIFDPYVGHGRPISGYDSDEKIRQIMISEN
jgi:Lysophospholipase